MSTERTLQIDGTSDQIEAAKILVNEVLNSEVCACMQRKYVCVMYGMGMICAYCFILFPCILSPYTLSFIEDHIPKVFFVHISCNFHYFLSNLHIYFCICSHVVNADLFN